MGGKNQKDFTTKAQTTSTQQNCHKQTMQTN